MFSATTSGASGVAVENVFSTSLYTGNGSTQTITNGIDLAGQGGLVWVKGRSAATNHKLTDTARGATNAAVSNSDAAQTTDTNGLTSFGSTGFSLGSDSAYNTNSATYVSWAFRKQPKFFDVVTYTGDGTNRAIAHNLGSVPGCIIVKKTTDIESWYVYHRSLGRTWYLRLNATADQATSTSIWNFTNPTDAVFTVGGVSAVNGFGDTYVAYLFAHDAGGFGPYGTSNAISCGSFITDGSGNATVTHGFTNGAQFCMLKVSSTLGGWEMFDTQRTPSWTSADARLRPNLSNAEDTVDRLSGSGTSLTLAGLLTSQTYVYILVAAPV